MVKSVAFVTDISGALKQLQKYKYDMYLSEDERRALKRTMFLYGFQIDPFEYKRDVKWDEGFVK